MTNEQKNQVAAMNASGMSVDEIVIDTGLDKADVMAFVAERNEKKGKRGHPISAQTKQAIIEWYQSGHKVAETAKKFGVDPKTVKAAVGLLPAKEKEPAAVAPATDSPNGNDISTEKYTTETAESQALEAARRKLLAIYETLSPEECRAWELGEVYAEVVRGLAE